MWRVGVDHGRLPFLLLFEMPDIGVFDTDDRYLLFRHCRPICPGSGAEMRQAAVCYRIRAAVFLMRLTRRFLVGVTRGKLGALVYHCLVDEGAALPLLLFMNPNMQDTSSTDAQSCLLAEAKVLCIRRARAGGRG